MTPFEKVYNRLFMLRPADTKHMNDCELVWRAAQDDHEAAVRAAVAAEREACAKVLRKVLMKVGAKVASERAVPNNEGTRCSWIELGQHGALDISNEFADLLITRCPILRAGEQT